MTLYPGLREYLNNIYIWFTLTFKPGKVGTITAPPHQRTELLGIISFDNLGYEMEKYWHFNWLILIVLHDYYNQTNMWTDFDKQETHFMGRITPLSKHITTNNPLKIKFSINPINIELFTDLSQNGTTNIYQSRITILSMFCLELVSSSNCYY